MTIYSPSGAVVYEAPITKSAIIRRELMGDYYIELVFDAVDRIDIGRGCYILYNNHRFEIMSNVIPDDTNQGGLRYSLRFEAQQSQMKRCNVFWREGENLEVSFALTSEISTFGQLIIDNVNAFLGGSTFTLGSVPAGAEMKTISFAGDSCWNAVATVAETFGVEWWTEEDGDNVRLCFGKLEIGDSVEFKKGDIVSSIPSKKGDDTNYGTRFYVFGSTKNLPEDYGSTVDGGVTNNVVEKRLHLPNGMQYIDAWSNLAPEDIVEKTVFFDDVMPTNVETITEVHSGNAEVIPGTSHKVYDVVCANSPFSLDDVIEGETIQANFTSGSLNGQTFDLELTQTNGVFNKTFRIVPKILDKDSLTILPQGEMIPRAGDTFILLNVNLPKGRIDEAEQRLLEVGQEYVTKNSSDTEIYDCPTNAVYCHRNDCNYVLGQRVTLVGEQFGASGRVSRIQGYEKKLYDEYQATYTVGDNSAYSRLASLEKSIQQATYSDRVGLEANIIRSKNDATIPSDFNVYSALASEEMFLSKRRGGTVKGHTDFEKGISLYGMPIYDAEKKRWTLEGDLLVTGAMTMYGLTGGEKPSTIMDAVQVDGKTIIKENGVLKINPNINIGGGSGTGGGGVADSVAWSNVTNKPTWITDTKPKYSYSEILDTPDLSVYAIKSSVDNALSNKADKATTLAGYGITNAYTKSEVNNIIDSLDDTYVTIAGEEQSITAEHNFVNGFKVGGLSVKKSQDKTLYLDANLVVSGAITMYGSDSTTFPTIWASIPFDSTMKWDGSKWSVVGGGSGEGGLDLVQLEDYLTTNGYATQSWVTGKGYITGINASMVTNALGYTPYNSSNPAGYITSSGSITGNAATATSAKYLYQSDIKESINYPRGADHAIKVVNCTTTQLDGFFAEYSTVLSVASPLSNFQIGMYANPFATWASHPRFRAMRNTDGTWTDWKELAFVDDLNAYLPLTGGTVNGNIKATSFIGNASSADRLVEEVVTDLNNATAGRIFTMTSGYGSTDGNKPTTGWVTGLTLQFAQNGAYRRQLAYSNVDLYIREEHNGVWEKWRKILTSTNFYDYALPKDGTASAAWKLANVRYLWGQLFDGTSNIGGQMSFNAGDFILAHNATDAWTDGNGLTHPWYGIDFRAGGSYKGYISHWSGISLVSGNDITLDTDKNVVVSNGKFRINQSAFNNGLTLNRTSANAGAGIVFQSNGSLLGQIGINGTKTFEISDGTTIKASIEIPTGNLITTGAITMYYSSDERLKQNIRKVDASNIIMSLGGVYQYNYIDSEVEKNSVYGGTHYGLIYQNVKNTALSSMCFEREDGYGSLNYLDTNFISLLAGATMENISEVEKLKKENKALKKRVEQLEKRVA